MVEHYLRGQVGIIEMTAPPVNSLNYPLRARLAEALEKMITHADVKAIVLTGGEACFSAGADIQEFGTPAVRRSPSLPDLIERIEASPKPVVAALGKHCLGGGLELALACHYRVALTSSRLGFPEIHLGLLPGAGGTQKMPRAIGIERSLAMCLEGRPVPITEFTDTPVVDEVHASELLTYAIDFAQRQADAPLRRLRDLPVADSEAEALFVEYVRNALPASRHATPAGRACVAAMDAALTQPIDQGLATEQQLLWSLAETPESASLRHAFFAEREAGRVPGLAEPNPHPIERVGVIGAGTMGSGIAQALLDAGLTVVVIDPSEQARQRARDTIDRRLVVQVEKGRITEEAAEATLKRLSLQADYAGVDALDLFIEAVFEDLEVKQRVFRQLDEMARPDALLASNTSTLDINALAAATRRPERVIGLHFFSPAPVMKLLEVVRGAATADSVLATGLALGKRLGKVSVVARVCDGFIGNRMINEYVRVAENLVAGGCSPYQVDQALERWGMAMGPFRMADMAGIDVGLSIKRRQRELHPGYAFASLAERLCDQGRLGQKVGRGWYDHAGRKPQPSSEVLEMIEAYRHEAGQSAVELHSPLDDQAIVERCLLALINEGARIVEEGVALRAGDVDVVYLYGYGFPRWRGGPLHYADTLGLYHVIRRLEALNAAASPDDHFWQPAELLRLALQHGVPLSQQGEFA